MNLTVMLVSYNSASLLPQAIGCLRSAASETKLDILVVDNASRDDSLSVINRECSDCKLIVNTTNVGFGRANNQLLDHFRGGYALLLNTDAFVSPDTLSKTISYMESHPDCGVLGVRLIGRDGDLQPSCRYFPTPFNVFLSRTGLTKLFPGVRLVDDMHWDHASERECDWVPGCYYLIRREVIDQVGLFDPRYFLYYEEVDHCKRVKEAGWKVIYFPHTNVVHIGGESAKSAGELSSTGRQLSALQIESEMLYLRKHHGLLGLAFHMILLTVGDAILTLKDVLKVRGMKVVLSNLQHTRLSWYLLFKTRGATQPTR